jgi:hypothetical protein
MDINCKEEFNKVKKNKFFDDLKLLRRYLSFVFFDLIERGQEKVVKELNQVFFNDYLKFPRLISENLMRIFSGGKKENIQKEEFVEGMIKILTADFNTLLRIFFRLCDFDDDGNVHVDDLMLIINYLNSDNYCLPVVQFQNFLREDAVSKNILTFGKFSALLKNKIFICKFFKIFLDGIPVTSDSINVLKIEEFNKDVIYEVIENSQDSTQEEKEIIKFSSFKMTNQENSVELFEKSDRNMLFGETAEEDIAEETSRQANTLPVFKSKNYMNFLNSSIGVNITTDSEKIILNNSLNYNDKFIKEEKKKFKEILPIIVCSSPIESETVLNWSNTADYQKKGSDKSLEINKYKNYKKDLSLNLFVHLKFTSTYEGFLYKFTKREKMHKYWIVLINFDLFY